MKVVSCSRRRSVLALVAAALVSVALVQPASAGEHKPGVRGTSVHLPASTKDFQGNPHPCAGRDLLYANHVDATYITREAGELSIMTVDGSEVLPSDSACMRLAPAGANGREVSRMVVPDEPNLRFLGAPGSIVWHAPFTYYEGHVPIWAGFGAFDPTHEHSVPDDFVSNNVELELVDFSGPGDMHVFNYVPGMSTPRRFISSTDRRRNTIGVGGHGHYDWVFTKPGIYALTWQAQGRHYDGSVEKSRLVTQYWLVGSDADAQLPAGTTRDLPGYGYSAEAQREAMGLKAPDESAAAPQEHFGDAVMPEDKEETENFIAKLKNDEWFSPSPKGIVQEGDARIRAKFQDPSDWPELPVTTDDGTAHGASPAVEVPDSTIRCIDPSDTHLGYLTRSSGSNAVYFTPAHSTGDAPSFGIDTTDVDYSILNSDSKVRADFSITAPYRGLAIGGIGSDDAFTPVVRNSGNSRSFLLQTPDVYDLRFMFTRPGIYTANSEVFFDVTSKRTSYDFNEIKFLVGNHAINQWRKLNNPSLPLLPESDELRCSGPVVRGADPYLYPPLVGVPEPEPAKPEPAEPTPSSTPNSAPEAPPAEPAEPAEPVEPNKPTKTADPVAPVKPADPEPPVPEPSVPEEPTPAQPTTAKPTTAKPTTAKPEPANPAPANPAPANPAPVDPEPTKPEPVKPEPTQPTQVKPTQVEPKPTSTTPTTPASFAEWEGFRPQRLVERGHMDLSLHTTDDQDHAASLKDGENPAAEVMRPSGSFIIAASDRTRTSSLPQSVTDYASEFSRGAWVLPQVQQQGVPWVGFSTDHADYQSMQPPGVRVSMAKVEGPGRIVTGHMDFRGEFLPTMDSADPEKVLEYTDPAHDHQFFLFSAPGAYRVDFLYEWVDSEGVPQSRTLTSLFAVGDAATRTAREVVARSQDAVNEPAEPEAPGAGEPTPGDTQPVDPTPVDPDPVDNNPVGTNPVGTNPVGAKPVAPKPGDTAPVPAQPTATPNPAVSNPPTTSLPTTSLPATTRPAITRPAVTPSTSPTTPPATSTARIPAAPGVNTPRGGSSTGSSDSLRDWPVVGAAIGNVAIAFVKLLSQIFAGTTNLFTSIGQWLGIIPSSPAVTADGGTNSAAAAPAGNSAVGSTSSGRLFPASPSVGSSGSSDLSARGVMAINDSHPIMVAAAVSTVDNKNQPEEAVVPLAAPEAAVVPLSPVEAAPVGNAGVLASDADGSPVTVAYAPTARESYLEGILVGVGAMSGLGALTIVLATLAARRSR